jgi:hypothetical protein
VLSAIAAPLTGAFGNTTPLAVGDKRQNRIVRSLGQHLTFLNA